MARPKLLGPYQIVEPLSESAEVRRWVARAAIDGATRRVELAVAKNEEAVGLIAQARGLERLEHPNSRTIVDYGLLEGRYYLALDDDEPTVKLSGGVVLPDSVVLEVGHALCGVLNHCQGSDVGYQLSLEEIGLTARGEVKLAGARLGAALPSLVDVAQLLVDLCSGGELRARLERVIEHGRYALEHDDESADDDDDDGVDDESDFAALERLLSALGSGLDEPISVASWVSRRRGRPEPDGSGSEREDEDEDDETLVASLSSFGGDDDNDSDEMGEDTKVGLVQDAVDGAIDRATVLPKPAPDAALRPNPEDDQPVLPVDWEDLGEPPTVAFDGFSALVRPPPARRTAQHIPTVTDHAAASSADGAPLSREPTSGMRAVPLDPDAPLPPREEKTGMRRVPTREVSTTEASVAGPRPQPRRRPPTGSAPAVMPKGGGLMRLTTRDVRRQRRPISTGVSRSRNISSVVAPLPKRRASKTKTRIDRTARMWLLIGLGAAAVALLAVLGIYLLL